MVEDPFTVSLDEKVALLMEASRRMQDVKGLAFGEASLDFYRRHTLFASSEGAAIEQTLVNSGGGIEATAIYTRHPEEHDDAARQVARSGGEPFVPSRFHVVRTPNDSKRLNGLEGPAPPRRHEP